MAKTLHSEPTRGRLYEHATEGVPNAYPTFGHAYRDGIKNLPTPVVKGASQLSLDMKGHIAAAEAEGQWGAAQAEFAGTLNDINFRYQQLKIAERESEADLLFKKWSYSKDIVKADLIKNANELKWSSDELEKQYLHQTEILTEEYKLQLPDYERLADKYNKVFELNNEGDYANFLVDAIEPLRKTRIKENYNEEYSLEKSKAERMGAEGNFGYFEQIVAFKARLAGDRKFLGLFTEANINDIGENLFTNFIVNYQANKPEEIYDVLTNPENPLHTVVSTALQEYKTPSEIKKLGLDAAGMIVKKQKRAQALLGKQQTANNQKLDLMIEQEEIITEDQLNLYIKENGTENAPFVNMGQHSARLKQLNTKYKDENDLNKIYDQAKARIDLLGSIAYDARGNKWDAANAVVYQRIYQPEIQKAMNEGNVNLVRKLSLEAFKVIGAGKQQKAELRNIFETAFDTVITGTPEEAKRAVVTLGEVSKLYVDMYNSDPILFEKDYKRHGDERQLNIVRRMVHGFTAHDAVEIEQANEKRSSEETKNLNRKITAFHTDKKNANFAITTLNKGFNKEGFTAIPGFGFEIKNRAIIARYQMLFDTFMRAENANVDIASVRALNMIKEEFGENKSIINRRQLMTHPFEQAYEETPVDKVWELLNAQMLDDGYQPGHFVVKINPKFAHLPKEFWLYEIINTMNGQTIDNVWQYDEEEWQKRFNISAKRNRGYQSPTPRSTPPTTSSPRIRSGRRIRNEDSE